MAPAASRVAGNSAPGAPTGVSTDPGHAPVNFDIGTNGSLSFNGTTSSISIPDSAFVNAGFGSFTDQVQTALSNELNQLTNGRKDFPIVFFCEGVRCWESYNAVLRAWNALRP